MNAETPQYSPEENLPPLEWADKVDNPTILLPGGLGTTDSNEGMRKALVRVLGEESVLVHPSDWSTDPQSQREQYEAKQIAIALQKNKPVRLVAHSMGAVTVADLLERVKEENPTLLEDPEKMKLLNIVLIGPAGLFKPGRASLDFVKRVQTFSSTQANARVEASAVNSDETSMVTFIDSLASYPIEGVDLQELVDFVHDAESPEAEAPEHVKKINFTPVGGYRQPELSSEDGAKLKEIDVVISRIFKGEAREYTTKTLDLLKYYTTMRNQLLQPYIKKAYDGTPPLPPERTARQKELTVLINGLLEVPTFLGMVGGRPLKMVEELRDKANISFIVPDRDLVMPLRDLEKLNLLGNVKALLKGYTHASWITGGSQVPGGDIEQALRAALNIPETTQKIETPTAG